MPRTLQANFTSGEISPRLHARVDLAQYQAGLAVCRNFVPSVYGGVRNRPGTRLVAAVKDEARRPRLIPFRFSSAAFQAYVLELGHLYMRVHMQGAPVLYPAGHELAGQPVEIATPWTEGDLPTLGYVQSADTMFLTHPGHAPRELRRMDHHAWLLTVMTFAPSIAAPGEAAFSLSTIGDGDYDGDGNDAAEPTVDYSYVITYERDGGEESLPSPAKSIAWVENLSRRDAVKVTVGALPAGVVRANIYKKRSGIFGWLGSIDDPAGGELVDDGISPKLDDTPPRSRNPFDGTGHWPAAVTFYQQRLAFAGSADKPDTLHLSQTGAYRNFSVSEPLRDSDAITATLAGESVDAIRHLVSLRPLLLLTAGSVWSLRRGDRALTPALEGGVHLELGYGAATVRPLQCGAGTLFVSADGRSVRDLTIDPVTEGVTSEEVSLLSEHLFRSGRAVDMAWQRSASTAWLVRSDGALLSLAYLKEQRVFAWARHDTAGQYESVACIPEGDEDAVYVAVRRRIGGQWRRFVERFAARQVSDIRDAYHVDCGLSYDAPVTITGIAVSGDGLVIVTAPGHGLAAGDWLDLDGIEGMPVLNGRRLVAGWPVTADSFALYLSGEDVGGEDGADAPRPADGLGAYLGGGRVRRAVRVLAGLGHLEGEEVVVLADGSVEGPYTVEGGAITLLRPASRVHAGLAYTCDLQTLPIPGEAEVRGRRKRVTQIQAHVDSTRGLMAGPSPDRLSVHRQRTDELLGDPTRPTTGMIELTVASTWNERGQVWIRQGAPLPIEVLAVSPVYEVGG